MPTRPLRFKRARGAPMRQAATGPPCQGSTCARGTSGTCSVSASSSRRTPSGRAPEVDPEQLRRALIEQGFHEAAAIVAADFEAQALEDDDDDDEPEGFRKPSYRLPRGGELVAGTCGRRENPRLPRLHLSSTPPAHTGSYRKRPRWTRATTRGWSMTPARTATCGRSSRCARRPP